MRTIVGYGNDLRGEDAFGVDVIKELQNYKIDKTKLISQFQLTPEIVLELLDSDEIIFVDATYSLKNHYALACNRYEKNNSNLSHHIEPIEIMTILNSVYKKYPNFQIFSMLTNNFETILNMKLYKQNIKTIVKFLASKA